MRPLTILALVVTLGATASISESAEAFVTRANCNLPTQGASTGKLMGARNAQRLVDAIWT